VLPRDVVTIFPPDDRVSLFVASMCMACNDIEDAKAEAEAANPPNADADVVHRRRFSYRVRMLNGHLYEGIVALKAWRQSEAEVRTLLDALEDEDAKRALKLVCGLEQRIGPKALEAVRQNSFHYPHPDPKRSPDSVAELAEAIRANPDLEADIDVGDDAQGTFRFADQLALSVAFGGHDPEKARAQAQTARIREAATAFIYLVKEIYLLYCRQRKIGFEIEP
jgi:hypothetical protein